MGEFILQQREQMVPSMPIGRLNDLDKRVKALEATPGGSGTPANSVVSEITPGQSPLVGVSTDYARADHTHGTPPASGGAEQAVLNVSTSQSIATNQVVIGDASVGNITLTLTNPATLQTVTIKKVDTSENSVFVTSASLIDGDAIAELSTIEESITLKWTGSTYDII